MATVQRRFPSDIIVIFVLSIVWLLLAAQGRGEGHQKVCIKEHCFDAEVVKEPAELVRGLQFRKPLPEDAGMLFVFPTLQTHQFWMKDTLMSLDMVWLDENQKIIYIARNVVPCAKDPCPTYGPLIASRYVLEVSAGQAQKYNILIGDTAEFNLEVP